MRYVTITHMTLQPTAPHSQLKKRIHHILILPPLLVILLGAWSSLQAQSGYSVAGIEIDGNQAFDDGELREIMVLKTASWFKRVFLGRDRSEFDETSLRNDLQRIKRYYQRRGFLNANVMLSELQSNDKNETVTIKIRVEENAPILNGAISYSFAENAADSSALMGLVPANAIRGQIPRGEPFRDADVTNVRTGLMDAFANAGYPYVDVKANLDIDTAANVVDINFAVDPGPLSYFGEVSISGRDRVGEKLIINQMRLKTGGRYSQKLLRDSQRQIFSLQVFEVVTVRAKLSEARDSIIPVQVNLSEAAQWSSKIGVGYGREDEFRAFTEMQLLSFMGGARRLTLYAKHSGLEPYHVNLELVQPAFLGPRNELSINPFVRKQEEPGYTVRRYGSHFSFSRRFNLFLSGTATYTFEQVRLDTNSVAEQATTDLSNLDLYNKSAIQLSFTWDDSYPAFSPERGWFGIISVKYSGLDLGSRFNYAKTLFDLRHYVDLGGVVLALRGKIGGIKSFDSEPFVPVEDRYFSGGSTSNRGWARGGLGPTDDEGKPIGGNSLFEGNVELRYPIIGVLSGVIFYDFGNVWIESYDYRPRDLRYATGLGLRLRTPIGPVRFDAGRPVFDDETTIQLHLSVGQAF